MSGDKTTAPKIVMIGGGTGSFTLLRVLKSYVQDLSAIVNMVDDGGSTGVLRDELGVLPPGDIRQCLVALSDAPEQMRELFTYRFPEGTFEGHSFGNLFLTAMEKMTDDFGEAIELASNVLNVQGKVIPVTLDKTTLVMNDGQRVLKGEYLIGHEVLTGKNAPKLYLEPNASLNPEARKALIEADIIVVAPGNLYGSLIPTFLVEGMKDALAESSAKVVQVINLMTMPGQTDQFVVDDYVQAIEDYIGRKRIDYVLYNNHAPSKRVLETYAKAGEKLVKFNDELTNRSYKAIGDKFVSSVVHKVSKDDPIAATRTLLRHDANKVARHIMRVFYS